MRKVINRKVYDTASAKMLAGSSEGFVGDYRAYREELFETSRGAYYLYGEGGPLSAYAECTPDGGRNGGASIIPLTVDQALDWCERHNEIKTMELIDPGSITDA